MLRDGHLMRLGDRIPVAALLALMLAGCSGSGLTSPPSTSTTSSSSSTLDKIESFFSSPTANSQQPVAGAPTAQEIDCPLINIRQGASTLTIGPTASNSSDVDSTNNGAMGVKYQGSFVRAARECVLIGGNVVMKIGVQGRIVVGPAGGPGEVNVPLRMAVVDETPNKTKPIVSRFALVPVTVASSTDNPTFSHIEENVSFPMPNDLDRYIVYVGFDPLALQAQQERARPKPARPRAKPKPAAPPQ